VANKEQAASTQTFEWDNQRYNQTREQHDGVACTRLDVAIAYGLTIFGGLAFALAGVFTLGMGYSVLLK